MRKWMLASAGLAIVLAGLAVVTVPSLLPARLAQPGEEAPPRSASLPIGQVVLFSSGVGYFQREGTVEGEARVDLSFPVSDINDLLKSMVLRDLDGGHISTVSYDSNAPVERTLKSFAINLTGNPSFAEILNQARGEKVEVTQGVQGQNLSGTIVGVEKQRLLQGKEQIEQMVLNLWCVDGMRHLNLSDVQRVRFLNPTLESELRKALETVARSHDTQKKAVSLRFVGEGKRRVRVGYVIENPIWKTSYRLVLPGQAAKEEKPYLQGWAVVENTSDEDWKEVRMTLVSGRPISFQMDLYQPLYLHRPTVVPELFASLNPVAYDGDLKKDKNVADAPPAPLPAPQAPSPSFGLDGEGRSNERERLAAGMPQSPRDARRQEQMRRDLDQSMDLGRSVAAAATAAKLGDNFQYHLDRPVSLARQKSALLPIVAGAVQATPLSIYNERVQPRFPLLGLRLKNTSGVHLMQGPITVFQGSNYAGDARIMDLQPNEERLLSYAVDLGMEVQAVPSQENGQLLSLKAVKGVLHQTIKNRMKRTYTAKNRNEQQRLLLIEHPLNPSFKLVGEQPKETTADLYRFELVVPAGASKELAVTQEQEVETRIAISSQSDEQIRLLLSQKVVSDKLRAGLQQAQKLRWETEKTRREIAELQRQLNTIVTDQGRLRANLREMPTTAQAYKRYLAKFDEQETQIEKYQTEIKQLQGEEFSRQKAFDDFLANFSAE